MGKRFIELAADYLDLTGALTEQQQSILEGIYRENNRWRKLLQFTPQSQTLCEEETESDGSYGIKTAEL